MALLGSLSPPPAPGCLTVARPPCLEASASLTPLGGALSSTTSWAMCSWQLIFRSSPSPWRKLDSVVVQSNGQFPLFSWVNFLVSCHHAISPADAWLLHSSNKKLKTAMSWFLEWLESHGDLWARTNRLMEISALGWFGRQGQAWVSRWSASRWRCGGPRRTGAGRVGGLGVGGHSWLERLCPPAGMVPSHAWVQGIPRQHSCFEDMFPSWKEINP